MRGCTERDLSDANGCGPDYNTATGSVQLRVNPATPKITWARPAAITYGTALTGTQLNATAPVPGNIVYSPAAGTMLTGGPQTLSVTFTPTDTTDYTTATAGVTITVNKASSTTTITSNSPRSMTGKRCTRAEWKRRASARRPRCT